MALRDYIHRITAPAAETKAAPAVPAAPGMFGLDWLVAGTESAAGVVVNATSAMRCAPYAACHRLLCDALATLPVKLMARLPEGGKAAATDHPLYALVHDAANEWTAAGTLRAQLIGDAIAQGNGFALVVRDGAGKPVELHRIDPAAVTLERDRYTAEPIYRVRGADGGETLYSFRDVVHVASPYRAAHEPLLGIGIPVIARQPIGLALLLESTAATVYRNAARPGAVLTMGKHSDEETIRNVLSSFAATFGGAGRGGAAVLDSDMSFQTVPAPAMTDAQFLETRNWQVTEIARVFGVPVSMIGDLSRATWSNSVEQNRQFLQFCLLPWLQQFEREFTKTLFTAGERDGYSIEFVTDGLLRASTQERAAAYAQWRSAGVFTSNELRALESLPARPDGDTLASPFTTSNEGTPAPSDEADDDENE